MRSTVSSGRGGRRPPPPPPPLVRRQPAGWHPDRALPPRRAATPFVPAAATCWPPLRVRPPPRGWPGRAELLPCGITVASAA